jgi:hypothetical protein
MRSSLDRAFHEARREVLPLSSVRPSDELQRHGSFVWRSRLCPNAHQDRRTTFDNGKHLKLAMGMGILKCLARESVARRLHPANVPWCKLQRGPACMRASGTPLAAFVVDASASGVTPCVSR